MKENDEEIDGIDFSAPLDVRYVAVRLICLIGDLMTAAFTEILWLKQLAAILFFSSFPIMMKKARTK